MKEEAPTANSEQVNLELPSNKTILCSRSPHHPGPRTDGTPSPSISNSLLESI